MINFYQPQAGLNFRQPGHYSQPPTLLIVVAHLGISSMSFMDGGIAVASLKGVI